MKHLHKLILVSFVGLAVPPSYGDIYEYSYNFTCVNSANFNGSPACAGAGDSVIGSFQGTPNGIFVDNISDVTMSFNGTPFSGTLLAGSFVTGSASLAYTPVVSSDVTQNDFIFYNAGLSTFLYIDFGYVGEFGYYPYADAVNANFEAYEPPVQTDWSLRDVSATPEPGFFVPVCGGLVIVLGVKRLRVKQLKRRLSPR